MKLSLNTRPDGSRIYYAETEDGQYDAVSDDAMGAVWQAANLMEEDLFNARNEPDKIIPQYSQTNNGDLIATYLNASVTLGVWDAKKQRGSYRYSDSTQYDADGEISFVHDLNSWMHMVSRYTF